MSTRVVVSQLVRKLGGYAVVASAIGARRDSVAKWPANGVPVKFRFVVRRLARERNVSLSVAEWRVLALEPAKEVTAG
jgi:hypothetical protein